MGIPYILDVKG